jgi:hypothetical protein
VIGPLLELQTIGTTTAPRLGFHELFALAVTAVNFAGAALTNNVTATVAVAAEVCVSDDWKTTFAVYVPGSMAPAVAFAWKESVAAKLGDTPVPAVPVWVTVSHPGTVLVWTLKNVAAVEAVSVTLVTAAEGVLGSVYCTVTAALAGTVDRPVA